MKLYFTSSDTGVEIVKNEGFCVSTNRNITYLYQNDGEKVILPEWIGEKPEEFILQNKGILICESKPWIHIYNDPFCSIPLYILPQKNHIALSADFAELQKCCSGWELDEAGFHEMALFGNCINDRTLFRHVKQLPASSRVSMIMGSTSYQIENYWNFNIYRNTDIVTEQDATEKAHEKLKEIFEKYKGRKLHMGLSGGLDSRMSACLLREVSDKENINCFTFGYSSHILEYAFAKKVAKQLHLKKPYFHKLKASSYLNSFDLPLKTGGQIGINHSHIYSYLSGRKLEGIFLSNYYSDAVMGWDAKNSKEETNLTKLSYFRKLESSPYTLSASVKEDILADLCKVVSRYDEKSNFSGLEEFFYVVERNPKFHVRMSFEYGNFIKTELPYANYQLLDLMISIPLEFRYEKKLEQNIANKYMIMNDISSRRYFEKSDLSEKNYTKIQRFYYQLRTKQYRLYSSVNNRLFRYSKGRIQIMDPFQTEDPISVVVKNETMVNQAADYLHTAGLIPEDFMKTLTDPNKKNSFVDMKLTFLGIAKCLKTISDGESMSGKENTK